MHHHWARLSSTAVAVVHHHEGCLLLGIELQFHPQKTRDVPALKACYYPRLKLYKSIRQYIVVYCYCYRQPRLLARSSQPFSLEPQAQHRKPWTL